MAVTEAAVMEALRSVPEPCSILMKTPMDICEMGLVEQVQIDGDTVAVTLLLTDPGCVHFTSMRKFITDVLLGHDGVEHVEVSMSTTQLWTSDRVKRRSAQA